MDADHRRSSNSGRRRWKWLVIGGLLSLFVLSTVLPETVGEQARRKLESVLNDQFEGMDVQIGRGRFEPRVGLVLSDLEFRSPNSPPEHRPLFIVDRLIAETDFDWSRTTDGALPVSAKRIIVSGLELSVSVLPDGTWSFADLLPLPDFGSSCPSVLIQDARIRLLGTPNQPTQFIELRDVAIKIDKQDQDPHRPTTVVTLVGTGAHVRQCRFIARQINKVWDIQGNLDHLRIERSLIDRLPRRFSHAFRSFKELDCTCNVQIRGRYQAEKSLTWSACVTMRDGRFSHPEFPMPIESLRGTITMTPEGIKIESLSGNTGRAGCRIQGYVKGYRWPCPLDIKVTADRLLLDDRVANALPTNLRQRWDRLDPKGRINLHANLKYQNSKWKFDGDVSCAGVEIRFDRFPYPVRQIFGTIHVANQTVWSEGLRGKAAGQPLECRFRLAPHDLQQPASVRITTEGPIPLDDALLDALTPRSAPPSRLEQFARSLSPAGSVQLDQAHFTMDGKGKVSQEIDFQIISGRLRYDRFPYPLHDVHGRVTVKDQHVKLIDFRGQNGVDALVRCNGFWRAVNNTHQLHLDFSGTDVPLNHTLRSALPASTQTTWDALAPAGTLDRILVTVESQAEFDRPKLEITAQQLGKAGVNQQTVNLRPTALPYRLDIVNGEIHYVDGRVQIDHLDGRHDDSRLTANGRCEKQPDGRWLLDMKVLSGSRLNLDVGLISSLPARIRGTVQRLRLRGPVNIRGQTSLWLPSQAFPYPEAKWDLQLQLEGNRLGDTGIVHDIRGEIFTQGTKKAQRVTASGIVKIDSLLMNDLQLTGISGPFSVRDEQLTVGTVQRNSDKSGQGQPIRGKIFGGTFGISGKTSLETGQFRMNARVDEARIPELLTDLNQPHADLVGKLSVNADVEGAVGAAHLLKGTGAGTLTEAKIYQIPQIVQLLTQLRLEPDEEAAFTDGTARFTISGDQLIFSELQFWGDLVALHGSGSVNRFRDVDLVFKTRVSPQNAWSRLLRPLRPHRYTLWTLNVRGPIDSPEIERRALDGVSETLERLFSGGGREGNQSARNFSRGVRGR